MFLDVNGVRLHAVSFGSGERTFLALGGFVGGWEVWQEPFELMSRDWRCVSYDHRGSGESPVAPELISRETLVGDVFAVMDALEIEHCVLGGESQGGAIAILAALQRPERFSGLVLVNSVLPVTAPLSDQRTQFMALLRADYRSAMDAFVRRCIPEADSDHVHRWVLDICLRAEPEAAVQSLRLFERRHSEEEDVHPNEVSVPTLVICGSQDRVAAPENARYLADTIPDATLLVIDGAGHLPTFTYPREVVAAIERRFGA